ncbi:serine/threonine protein kinase [Endozoicomonas sp. SM1973]|uniref:Stress response kinase A n=1 Tax=Spartinivicinus marinus TaxID=2994442 RepID=A0A853I6I8_9GAMM|nr:serine/threonine protein kinase [Spartinivicinus marinus]MCX4026393.1 serine/threonine protein kinase [Spartinivicinus marinus]NYZ67262.1 serine/threonine protein kinase [Spartinivicinus marinus]
MSHPYDSLTPDTIIEAVESLGYLSDNRIFPLNSYENRVYQVGIEEETPLIAKFYRPERWSKEQILEEHDFIAELAEVELPAVQPVKINSCTLHEHKGFQFALFPRYGGHAPECDDADTLLQLGRLLGRIHQVGAVKPFQHRPGITIEQYATNSYRFLLESNFIPLDLVKAYQTLAEDCIKQVEAIWQSGIKPTAIRIHGDCHLGNILTRGDQFHFVDFDDSRMAPAIQDLWMFLSGDRHQQTAQLSELIGGYNEFYTFNTSELRLIEVFRTLRLMHYSAWLAKRWDDPAFPHSFTWFNTPRYWADHILELREQLAALQEAPLSLY